jgi:preprotein translocase subunit SecA
MQLIEEEMAELVDSNCVGPHSEEWDTVNLYNSIGTIMPLPPDLTPEAMEAYSQDELADTLMDAANATYEEREAKLTPEVVRAWERRVLLVTMSGLWIHHVDAMDELREAAMLQAFGQQDPLVAYKRQGFDMFQQFQSVFRQNVVHQIYHLLFQPTAALILEETNIVPTDTSSSGNGAASNGNGAHGQNGHATRQTAQAAASHSKRAKAPAKAATGGKIGRNEPCFCGSGKKYKHCHGRA